MALEVIANFETQSTLSAWPYWKPPTTRWEDERDMTQLFRELLAMTGRDKEFTITANTMLQGLHRHGLYDFCSPTPPLIGPTTFIELACEELEKIKNKIHEPQIVRPTPITPSTKPQSSPSLAGDDT